MLKIGDFSKLSRISIRMLRHYDEIGLLKPDNTDAITSYRYYSAEQLPVANRINSLKAMGFGLGTIAEVLAICHDSSQLEKYLHIRLAEAREEYDHAQSKLLLLETTLKRLRKDETTMKYDVILKTMPERYVASIRDIIPDYQAEHLLWERMMTALNSLPVAYASPKYPVAVFHDEGYKEADVDVEIQVPLSSRHDDTGDVKFKTVAPINIASVTYQGSYDALPAVNECIASWTADNGYRFDSAMFLIYHVSPAVDPNPENWITEVCYPVVKVDAG